MRSLPFQIQSGARDGESDQCSVYIYIYIYEYIYINIYIYKLIWCITYVRFSLKYLFFEIMMFMVGICQFSFRNFDVHVCELPV